MDRETVEHELKMARWLHEQILLRKTITVLIDGYNVELPDNIAAQLRDSLLTSAVEAIDTFEKALK